MEINKKNRWQILLLVLILLIAAFLRLYRIKDYIIFLGDQGRDVLIVKRIIIDHKFTLLGPTTSVGGFYLGPFYYYLMIIPLALSNLDPVGPAIMVAVLGIASVYLVYYFLNRTFGWKTATLAGALYAVSPLTVAGSRFSWNPNVLPFFSLVFVILLYFARVRKSNFFIFAAGIVLGICFQLHYLALSLAPVGLVLIFAKLKKWLVNSFLLFSGCLISLSPFLFFEIRHGFTNFKTIIEFITRRDAAIIFYPLNLIPSFFVLSEKLFAQFFGLEINLFSGTLVCLSLLFIVIEFFKKEKRLIASIVLVWWIGGIFFLNLYQGVIYNYYYGYLFPIPAITLGIFLNFLIKQKIFISRIIFVIIFVAILYKSYLDQPILIMPNRILDQTERIAQDIIIKANGKPFNFALISPGNSDYAYRYFLEIKNHKPVQLEDSVQEQLFIVCEQEICKPLGHPLWEIAAFGRAEIADTWMDKVGIRVFRMIHHQDSINLIGKPAPKGI